MATSHIVEHVGRVLSDRYRLTRPLGTGASAHVYVAEDVTLRRRVAVKLLHPALASDEAFLRRFQAEARVVAALRHPNIVRVYDWGEDHGSPFLVMELLAGGSLRGLLDRGQLLTPAQAARVGGEAARALDYAHRRGLVHRDIKPANLLFDDEGVVSVADFGLARALAEATWTEPVGAMVGTARYAAPEQIGGGPLDGKADVYSLALVLVEAVTGKVPFAADTTIGTLMARVDRDLPVPDEVGALGPALAAAGSAQVDQRADASALANALATAARQLPPPAPLTLARDRDDDLVDEDADATEFPGRTRLFDAEQLDGAEAFGEPARASPARRSRLRRASAAGPLAIASESLPGPDATRSPTTSAPAPGPNSPRPAVPLVPLPAPRRRRRRLWLIALAVLLVAGGLGIGAAIRLRTSKPRHPVPNVVHETPAAAGATLARLHFTLRVANQVYDEQVGKGLIVSQGQPANKKLPEGSIVPVVVSLGPPLVTVPDLSNASKNDATNRLLGAGLHPGQVTSRYDDNTPKGNVLSWTGQGGQLPKGSTVDLVLSDGPPTVPVPSSVVGGTFANAQSVLGGINLSAVENDVFSNAVPKGQVIGTTPPPGTSVHVGSDVTITVSKGPDLVVVPEVRGQTIDAATQALQNIGLSVSGVTGPASPSGKVTVTRTAPAAGAQVLRGSSVQLITN